MGDYIHKEGIHNILWEYAPAKPSSDYASAFHDRYPGSDRVDIIAFDRYDYDYSYADDILDDCRVVAEFAHQHNKLAAIGETGIFDGIQDETTTYKDWYYTDFAENFMTDSYGYCNQIVYALLGERQRALVLGAPPQQRPLVRLQQAVRVRLLGLRRRLSVADHFDEQRVLPIGGFCTHGGHEAFLIDDGRNAAYQSGRRVVLGCT